MSRLTSSTVVSWSGVSHEREGVLELALPRRVRTERVAPRGLPRGVQLDQLGRDLADRLAGPSLALGPVGTAEPVQAGHVAADVAGHLVELVGRDVELVRRSAALRGAVLEHEVLAGGALHDPLPHLDVAAHAVLLVHDVVTRLQLERVDLSLATGRHPPHVLGRRPLPDDVVAGEHRQALLLVDETVEERAGGDGHDVVRDSTGRVQGLLEARRHIVVGQHLDHALSGAVALVDQPRPAAGGQPCPDVHHRTLDVTPVGLRRADRDAAARGGAELDVDAGVDDLAGDVPQPLTGDRGVGLPGVLPSPKGLMLHHLHLRHRVASRPVAGRRRRRPACDRACPPAAAASQTLGASVAGGRAGGGARRASRSGPSASVFAGGGRGRGSGFVEAGHTA